MSDFTFNPFYDSWVGQVIDGLMTMVDRGDDGGTVWSRIGGNPTMEELAIERGSGFVVGGVVPALILRDVRMVAHPSGMGKIRNWIEDNSYEVADCDGVGFWIGSDGRVWFDVVEVYRTERQALHAARVAGELAIWDMVNGVEITL